MLLSSSLNMRLVFSGPISFRSLNSKIWLCFFDTFQPITGVIWSWRWFFPKLTCGTLCLKGLPATWLAEDGTTWFPAGHLPECVVFIFFSQPIHLISADLYLLNQLAEFCLLASVFWTKSWSYSVFVITVSLTDFYVHLW